MISAHSHEVISEVLEAFETYERQRAGRGDRFEAALRRAFGLIREHPKRWRVISRHGRIVLRKLQLARFPYAVIYYVRRDGPVVLAVAHGKREPGYFLGRL